MKDPAPRTHDALEAIRQTLRDGRSRMARCPAHDDKNPSLSISKGDDGRLLLKCHGGCPQGAVIRELARDGLTREDLFGNAPSPPERNGRPTRDRPAPTATKKPGWTYRSPEDALRSFERELGPITTTYPYDDDQGERVMAIGRFDPPGGKGKEFRPVHRLARGSWAIGDLPEPLPLYRLRDIEGAQRILFVVEGEKCVDVLRYHGLPAVTSSHGAKSAARSDWTPAAFAGVPIILWPDNDESGRQYIADVAELIRAANPEADVRLLDMALHAAQLPEGGDAADVLADQEYLLGLLGDEALERNPRTVIERLALAAPRWEQSIEEIEEDPPIVVRPWPEVTDPALWDGLAGSFAHFVRPQTESDALAILVQLLVMFGHAVGRSPYMMVESTRHGCNENVLLVGRTSVSRKGPAVDRAKALFCLADPEWSEKQTIGGLSTGEGLIYHVRDPIYKTEHVKEKGRIVETVQALADPGISDKRLLCLETEFARVLHALEREGNTLSATIRQAWDGSTLRVATRNNALVATGAHISVIGHCVNAELTGLLSRTDAVSGFGNRFLYFAIKRSQLLPFGGDPLEMDNFATALRDALAFGRETGFMRWSSEARPLWRRAYPDLSQERAGLLGELTARNAAHALRLAMIYSLLDQSREITPRAVLAALALVNQSTRSIVYIFGDSIGEPDAEEIMAALQAAGSRGLTRTEISDRVFQRHASMARITRALELLLNYQLATYCMESTQGRRRQRWFLATISTGPCEIRERSELRGP
jgi:hypothetical protein